MDGVQEVLSEEADSLAFGSTPRNIRHCPDGRVLPGQDSSHVRVAICKDILQDSQALDLGSRRALQQSTENVVDDLLGILAIVLQGHGAYVLVQVAGHRDVNIGRGFGQRRDLLHRGRGAAAAKKRTALPSGGAVLASGSAFRVRACCGGVVCARRVRSTMDGGVRLTSPSS